MTSYSFVLSLIDKIPSSLWAAVTGSLLTLAGVALTNRASHKRLVVQLVHEQKQKTIDREMALRQKVYFAAAEAMAAGISTIGRLPDLNLPNNKVTGDYFTKSPAMMKAQVIAKPKTLRALANFTDELGAVFLRLLAKRTGLEIDKNQISFFADQIDQSFKRQAGNLEMRNQQNIDGELNTHRSRILQKNWEFEKNNLDTALAQHDERYKSFLLKQFAFMRECVEETSKLGRLGIPVLSAVREELELSFDEEGYRQLFEEGVSKQELVIDEFIEKFKAIIASRLD